MATTDILQFHELAQKTRGKIPLKQLCNQEGVSYRRYYHWRKEMGIALRVTHKGKPLGRPQAPVGMFEVVAEKSHKRTASSSMVASVHITFESGVSLDRQEIELDVLVEFLTKICSALCLG